MSDIYYAEQLTVYGMRYKLANKTCHIVINLYDDKRTALTITIREGELSFNDLDDIRTLLDKAQSLITIVVDYERLHNPLYLKPLEWDDERFSIV